MIEQEGIMSRIIKKMLLSENDFHLVSMEEEGSLKVKYLYSTDNRLQSRNLDCAGTGGWTSPQV